MGVAVIRYLTAGLAAALLLAGSASAAPDQWTHKRFPALGYAMDFPAEPTAKAQKAPLSATQNIDIAIEYVDMGAKGAVLMAMSDYSGLGAAPSLFANPDVQSKILEGGVQGAVTESHSTLVSETTISVEGNPGREIYYKGDKQPFVGKAWIILVGERAYALTGVGEATAGVPRAFERMSKTLTFKVR
jgi:hypothetical protein